MSDDAALRLREENAGLRQTATELEAALRRCVRGAAAASRAQLPYYSTSRLTVFTRAS